MKVSRASCDVKGRRPSCASLSDWRHNTQIMHFSEISLPSFFPGGNAQTRLTSSQWMTSQSISESQSLVTPSLEMSHKIGRNLAKLAMDSVCLLRREACGMEKGAKFNTIPSDIREDEYSSLCDDRGLVLVRINYCQRALSVAAKQLTKQKLSEDSEKSEPESKASRR
jgi:hypothetical protein